jgi:hypothetical protein
MLPNSGPEVSDSLVPIPLAHRRAPPVTNGQEDGSLGPSLMRWLDDGGSVSTDTADAATLEQQPAAGAEALPPHRYRCSCGRLFQVYGLGRHRRYYQPDDGQWRRPVVARTCTSCQRQLPA